MALYKQIFCAAVDHWWCRYWPQCAGIYCCFLESVVDALRNWDHLRLCVAIFFLYSITVSVFSNTIGYWRNPVVRLSVCLSVCNAVHCGPRGWCTRLKVVPVCSKKTRAWVFFHHQVRVLVYSDYLLLTCVAFRRHVWVDSVNVLRNEGLRSDSSVPAAHRPKLVTIGLIVRQYSLRTPGSICTSFCSYNSACINNFIRVAAITMNRVKRDITL